MKAIFERKRHTIFWKYACMVLTTSLLPIVGIVLVLLIPFFPVVGIWLYGHWASDGIWTDLFTAVLVVLTGLLSVVFTYHYMGTEMLVAIYWLWNIYPTIFDLIGGLAW